MVARKNVGGLTARPLKKTPSPSLKAPNRTSSSVFFWMNTRQACWACTLCREFIWEVQLIGSIMHLSEPRLNL